MAIDFKKTFGVANGTTTTETSTQTAKPKAQFWLNVGYITDQKDESGEYRFVSLASGIALDTMETLPTNSKNKTFGMFQAARNGLRDQLVTAAKELKPGEAAYISAENGLQLQIRRVGEEVAAPMGDENPFIKQLSLQ